ncbi:MAG: RHS repeat-associated core domain-containing protein [Pirellulales bacterium]
MPFLFLGSTRRLVDSNQAEVYSAVYKAFGEVHTTSGTNTSPFGWVGRVGYRHEPSLGPLYHVRARSYHVASARWMSEDPLLKALFQSQATSHPQIYGDIRSYQYVNNRPATLSDPSGLAPLPIPIPWLILIVVAMGCPFGAAISLFAESVARGIPPNQMDFRDRTTLCNALTGCS